MLFINIIEIFRSRDITLYGILAHFEFEIHKDFKTISSLCLQNCFKYYIIYILGQNVPKIRQE